MAFFRSDAEIEHGPAVALHIAWCELTADLGTEGWAQQVVPLDQEAGPQGWFAYLAKHAGRGLAHYQRDRAQLPEGWQTSGRMWGKRGAWPTSVRELDVPHVALDRIRRAVHAYELSKLRTRLRRAELYGDDHKARSIRRLVGKVKRFRQKGDRVRSHLQGVKEWLPLPVQDRILVWACEGTCGARPWPLKPSAACAPPEMASRPPPPSSPSQPIETAATSLSSSARHLDAPVPEAQRPLDVPQLLTRAGLSRAQLGIPEPADLPPRDPRDRPITRRIPLGTRNGLPHVFVDTPSTQALHAWATLHPEEERDPYADLAERCPEAFPDGL